jgi:hypothetical protein
MPALVAALFALVFFAEAVLFVCPSPLETAWEARRRQDTHIQRLERKLGPDSLVLRPLRDRQFFDQLH